MAASYPNPSGRVPKPESQRRRRNTPKSYGAAEVTSAPSAPQTDTRELAVENPHAVIAALWDAVQTSCEARFYSSADWARLRMELWFADKAMAAPVLSARAWDVVQHGLNEMLLSPAVKRRAGIEVRPTGPDVDADAAVSMIGRYRQNLKSV